MSLSEEQNLKAVYDQRWVTPPTFADKPGSFIPAYTSWIMSRVGSRCEFFERQWIECGHRVGLQVGMATGCADELDDLRECISSEKTFKRYSRMQEERQKRKVPYQNPPPVDMLQLHKFKTSHF